ncbi:MAG TPA: DCC1-like thiol-disulfide oxidoreductase family protein [Terriglobia bacterium]|nr:DCC1-like thiol-disulfide oxidoreductase family protein [Terriglobia bacterium]
MNGPARPASPAGQHLLLYDGVCGLCNRLIGFILPRDPNGVFHYAALQSPLGRSIVQRYGGDPEALETFYLVVNHHSDRPQILRRARAALFVLKTLGLPWSLPGVFGVLPDAVLNAAYDFVARRRYRIFGRYDTCLMPDPAYRQRFHDEVAPDAPEGALT